MYQKQDKKACCSSLINYTAKSRPKARLLNFYRIDYKIDEKREQISFFCVTERSILYVRNIISKNFIGRKIFVR